MKIKKTICSLALMLLLALSGLYLSACNEDKVLMIVSVDGLENSVVLNGEYDTSNATAKILFSSTKIIDVESADLEFGELDTTQAGEKTLVISYTQNDVTVTFDFSVEVYEDSVVSISEVLGFNKSVRVGEEYDTSTITLSALYRSGKTQTVLNSELAFSEINTSSQGIKTLSITYGSFNIEKDVYVYETDKVNAIVSIQGLITSVMVGEQYSTDDIIATVIRTTGETFTVSADKLDFTNIDTSTAGNKILTISYTEDSVTVSRNETINVFEDTVVSCEVVTGSYDKNINIGTEFDTSNIVLRLTLDTGNTFEVPARYLDITPVDTLDEGEQQFSVSYEYNGTNVTANCTVNIVRNYSIYGFVAPTLVTSYNTNSQIKNTYNETGSNGVKGFATTGNEYVVGDDNEFIFEPSLNIVYTGTYSQTSSKTYKADYSIYLGSDANGQPLEGDDLLEYVVINDVKHTLKFTQKAIGEHFYISVLPKYASSSELSKIYATTFSFKVIDGYNIYNAKQLSILDNVNAGGKWTEFKTQNGIDTNLRVDSIILHSDINITNEDIPSIHLYSEQEVAGAPDYSRVLGSLKDRDIGYGSIPGNAQNLPLDDSGVLGAIYRRAVEDNSQFTIEGNYFQISVARDSDGKGGIPLIVRESGDSVSTEGEAIVSHTTLLTVEGMNQQYLSDAQFNLNNIALFGNAQKTEDVSLSGGLMFLKSRNVVSNIYNNLSQSWYMSYMFRGPDYKNVSCYTDEVLTEDATLVTLNGVNAYDAYNTLLYLQGAGHVLLEDSVMIGAGGPVMIVDHAKNKNAKVLTGRPCFINVDNCILESYVAGSEAWFVSMNADSMAGDIKKIDGLFTAVKAGLTQSIQDLNNALDQYGLTSYKVNLQVKDKTILYRNRTMLNLVAVFKSDNTAGMEDEKTASTFNDITKNSSDELKFSTGLDLIERDDIISQSSEDISLSHIFKAFDGLILVPNSEGTALSYQYPQITVDAETAIGAKLMYDNDTYLNQLIQELTTFVETYNNFEDYFGGYLFNNMGIILGAETVS